jgi:hypothetical protein
MFETEAHALGRFRFGFPWPMHGANENGRSVSKGFYLKTPVPLRVVLSFTVFSNFDSFVRITIPVVE